MTEKTIQVLIQPKNVQLSQTVDRQSADKPVQGFLNKRWALYEKPPIKGSGTTESFVVYHSLPGFTIIIQIVNMPIAVLRHFQPSYETLQWLTGIL